jgi:hypothetical protein
MDELTSYGHTSADLRVLAALEEMASEAAAIDDQPGVGDEVLVTGDELRQLVDTAAWHSLRLLLTYLPTPTEREAREPEMSATCKHCGSKVTTSADVRTHWFCTRTSVKVVK